MPRQLVCMEPGKIEWRTVPDRPPGEGQVRVISEFGVEKHGTMAAFIKGYANERGRWDDPDRVFRPDGVLWAYPIPLGNMQFGRTERGDRAAWWGAFEEYRTIAVGDLWAMGDVDWRDAAMLDPGEFALGALRDGNVRIGDDIAVFGLGAIGLAVVQLAFVAGAARVFAVDPIAERRLIAERFGAVAIDPGAGDAGLALRDATGKRGVDVAVDFSGNWRALQAAFRGVAYGGTIAYGAFPAPFGGGLDLGAEAHMNRQKLVFTRACSDPNPDYPRWNEDRLKAVAWQYILDGKLCGTGIVDEPIAYDDLLEVYPQIAAHPERHLKLSVRY